MRSPRFRRRAALVGAVGATVDSLENRLFLSSTGSPASGGSALLDHQGTLTAIGTTGNDQILVSKSGPTINVRINSHTFPGFAASAVKRIVAEGLAGNDTITVSAGDLPAVQYGGPGNDVLTGGQGPNTLFGGAGNDDLRPGPGPSNDIYGGDTASSALDGLDTVDYSQRTHGMEIHLDGLRDSGMSGEHDLISPGVQRAYGSQGNDIIFANPNGVKDALYGLGGNDTLYAGSAPTALYGGNGNDTLYSLNDVADYLDGGPGNDSAHADYIDQLVSVENMLPVSGFESAVGGEVVAPVQGEFMDTKVLPDGKILAAGDTPLGNSTELYLTRYLPDGTLDPTFGSGGQVITNAGGILSGTRLALAPNGQFYVGGNVLLRFNANDSLDTSFGSGGVVAFNDGSSDTHIGIAVQSDGKVVVAHNNIVSRYHTNGTFDTSFANGGQFTDALQGVDPIAFGQALVGDVAMQGNKIILGLGLNFGSDGDALGAERLNANGTIDRTFGANSEDGIAGIAAHYSGHRLVCSRLKVQSNGVIDIVGVDEDQALSGGTISANGKQVNIHLIDRGDNIGDQDTRADIVTRPDGTILSAETIYEWNAPQNHFFAQSMQNNSDFLFLGPPDEEQPFFSNEGKAAMLDLSLGGMDVASDGSIIIAGSNGEFQQNNQPPFVSPYLVRFTVRAQARLDPHGLLTVNDSIADDYLSVTSDGTTVSVKLNNLFANPFNSSNDPGGAVIATFPASKVKSLQINGGPGSEYLYTALTVPTTINGGAGDDSLVDGSGPVTMNGGDGRDVLYARNTVPSGNSDIDPLELQNPYAGASIPAILNGDAGDDSLVGGGGPNTLNGGDGADVIYSRNNAPDTVNGGDGSDTAYAEYVDSITSVEDVEFPSGFGSPAGDEVTAPLPGEFMDTKVQPDGKILAVGDTPLGNGSELYLTRFLPDGTLDPSFGNGGQVVTNAGGIISGTRLALAANGQIYVGGNVLLRFNGNGTLDTTFGAGGVVSFNDGSADTHIGLAIQPDGKIVVAHNNIVSRYKTSGALDSGFATSGHFLDPLLGFDPNQWGVAEVGDVAIQGNQIALGLGLDDGFDSGELGVERLNPNGTIDRTFGDNGIAAGWGGDFIFATRLKISPNGTFNIVGVESDADFDGGTISADGKQVDIARWFDGDDSANQDTRADLAILPDGTELGADTIVNGEESDPYFPDRGSTVDDNLILGPRSASRSSNGQYPFDIKIPFQLGGMDVASDGSVIIAATGPFGSSSGPHLIRYTTQATAALDADGTLTINDSVGDNSISVTSDGTTVSVKIGFAFEAYNGQDPGGTTIASFPASQVVELAVNGGAGNEYIYTNLNLPIRFGTGSVTLTGGGGNDTLISANGPSTLIGGAGDDVLDSRNLKRDSLDGGDGNDTARIDAGLDSAVNIEHFLT